jgi:hypothetical protein
MEEGSSFLKKRNKKGFYALASRSGIFSGKSKSFLVIAHPPLPAVNLLEPAPGSKSLLILFFRKEQDSSFSEEKEAKRLLFFSVAFEDTGFGRIATQDQ